MTNRGEAQTDPRRDLNTMDVERGREGDRTYYVYRKWCHMAKNCWKRHRRKIVKMLQKLAKENGEQ